MKRDLMPVTYGSVCSGIEAATVAVEPIGWEAAWLAEIEPSPSKVLHHHYGAGRPLHMPSPDDDGLSEEDRDARRAAIKSVSWLPEVVTAPRNLGDFTKIAAMVRSRQVAAPDVLIGGTPCQAFSIAGLRAGLSDARGALTLSFVKLANEIDTARSVLGKPPAVIWWENVPGVLSSKDNAFGCFLAGLVGEDDPLVAPGGKWPNAGVVVGPQRAVAWRVIDAQYFGVPQRRRRVFVVGSARKGFDPAEILFEFDGVRRDTPPSREAREGIAGGFEIGPSSGRFTDVAPTLDCRAKNGPVQNQLGVGVIQSGAGVDLRNGAITGDVAHTIQAGVHAPDPGGTPHVLSVALRGREGGGTAELGDDLAMCLRASTGGGDKPHVLAPIAFDSRQECVSSTEVFGALGSSSPQAQAVCVTGDITHTLKAEGFDASEDGTGRGQPIVAACLNPQESQRRRIYDGGGIAPCLSSEEGRGHGVPSILASMAVRRLTPVECERLQAFPDNYTLVPTKKISKARAEKLLADGDPAVLIGDQWWEQSADGPRYKALGNSMCVKNMAWIGRRIDAQLRALEQK